MRRRFFFPAVAATVALTGALAACQSGEVPNDNPNVDTAAMAATDSLPEEANATDIHFLGMMVPHHEQAIEMSEILLDSDVDDPQVRDLAERIRDGQERENKEMNRFADEWGQGEAMEFHSHHIANGMVSPGVMDDFRALQGEELRVRFLELMHFHHAEVIAMTQDEVDNGGYQPLKDMAQDMIDVQTAEMGEMEDILGYVPEPS